MFCERRVFIKADRCKGKVFSRCTNYNPFVFIQLFWIWNSFQVNLFLLLPFIQTTVFVTQWERFAWCSFSGRLAGSSNSQQVGKQYMSTDTENHVKLTEIAANSLTLTLTCIPLPMFTSISSTLSFILIFFSYLPPTFILTKVESFPAIHGFCSWSIKIVVPKENYGWPSTSWQENSR